MNKKILQLIPSIVLYVFAVPLLIFAIWSFVYCADIISQAKAAGQLAGSGYGYDIASFYMANCGQFFVYALLLAAAGLLLQRRQPAAGEAVASVDSQRADGPGKTGDVELDEWFSEESAPEADAGPED